MKLPRPSPRCLLGTAIALAAVLLAAALPVVWIETRCTAAPAAVSTAPPSRLPSADRRAQINSYLTYPEWSIVHAYEDLAAVTRAGSESDYDYFAAIGRYWTSLCSITRMASSKAAISTEYKTMLHVIGLSFAAEMGIKGAYEKTFGRITTWIRGPTRTPEDDFALALADDYAAFLRQTPWYEYPFATKLWRFWADTPLFRGNIVRKLERRFALTLEWGGKSIYARLIGFGAAASPAALRIKSVVTDLTGDDLNADPRITSLGPVADGTVIETDRYRTFTEILRGLAARGRNIREIAGNSQVLATIFAPDKPAAAAAVAALPGAALLFSVPVRARPGWNRLALDVKVTSLTDMIRQLERSGLILEHVYDY